MTDSIFATSPNKGFCFVGKSTVLNTYTGHKGIHLWEH
jgi:hypothetical protein